MTELLSILANIFTIVAAGIAIYLFFYKGNTIRSIFNLLLNYSIQMTLGELKSKLDRLNDLNVNDKTQKQEVVNVFNEIEGQIRGNNVLRIKCKDILAKVSHYANSQKELSEPKKRSVVSELRETLRNIDVQTYDEITRG